MMNTKTIYSLVIIVFFSITTLQAQEKTHNDKNHNHKEMKMEKPMYACPMHADEKSDKAGECSKCGMKMKKMEMKKGEAKHDMKSTMKMDKNKMAKAYMCPMKCEGDKTYDKEGNCPKCGMSLKEVKAKQEHDDHREHKH